MSENTISIIKTIQDSQVCRVKLTTLTGESSVIDCVYKEDVSPNFFLTFGAGDIPADLDEAVVCAVSFDGINPPLSLEAKIISKSNKRTLSMMGFNAVDPTSMREYFRVDMQTPITVAYYPDNPDEKGWKIEGKTLDVSGTGILAVFSENIVANDNVMIDLYLDYYEETISCFANVIRCRRLKRGKYQAAFELKQLGQNNRDKLITCCLHEQRRSLRTKVQTLS